VGEPGIDVRARATNMVLWVEMGTRDSWAPVQFYGGNFQTSDLGSPNSAKAQYDNTMLDTGYGQWQKRTTKDGNESFKVQAGVMVALLIVGAQVGRVDPRRPFDRLTALLRKTPSGQ
jgi:hypothetical protein